ncbi:MAG: hypothetical protein ABSG53_07810, partial [Thermoguttaceae bacterium]
PWEQPGKLTATERDAVCRELLEFCAAELAPDNNRVCACCELRFVCGGLDCAVDGDDGAAAWGAIHELICSTRRFFLEAFLWQKAKLEELAASCVATPSAVPPASPAESAHPVGPAGREQHADDE